MATPANQINFPYTAVELTDAISETPNLYGRINELDIFPGEGVTTTLIEIRREEDVLAILPAEERGAPANVSKSGTENSLFLKIPHFPLLDTIKPEDLQDRFAFAKGPRRLLAVQDAVTKKLQQIRNKHSITLEFLRMGALKGLLVDGRNDTLYNFYNVFGIEQKVINFALNNDATNVLAKCHELCGYIEDNLKGEVSNGVHCFISQEFFDAFTDHPKVKEAYLGWSAASQLASGEMRKRFPFGGIDWEIYRGTASDATGATRRFIAAGEGHAYPTGTLDTFKTVFGPANTIQTVNTVGTEIFVSPEILKHGKGVELASESNPLPIVQRPKMLVKVVKQ